MATGPSRSTTEMLSAIASGDSRAADELLPLVYDEFHRLAEGYLRRESPGHTLQPTALVNEAYLKLVDQSHANWKGRTHFFAIGAQAMRRILVDHARGKHREKRGGGLHRIALDEEMSVSPRRDEDLVELDEALNKLAKLDPRQARIVELRFFGGLTVAEVADVLGVSKRTVENEWTMVRAWLRRELTGDSHA